MSFRIFGIRIVLTNALFIWIVILCALFSWKTGAKNWAATSLIVFVLMGVVYTIVVLHELGHSLAAKKLGYDVQKILLHPFGGMAVIGNSKNNDWRKNHLHEFWITICGPLVNIFILMLFTPLLYFNGPTPFVDFVCYLNWVLLVFNLIPIYPMDGGRLMRCFLTWCFRGDYKRSTKWAQHITFVVLVGAMPVFIHLGWWMAIVVVPIVVLMGIVENQQLNRPSATPILKVKVSINGVEMGPHEAVQHMKNELAKLDPNDPEDATYGTWLSQNIRATERALKNVRSST